MRRNSCYITGIFFLLLIAVLGNNTWGQTWLKAFQTGSYDEAQAIVQLHDGSIAVAGTTSSSLDNRDIFVNRIDIWANSYWQKMLGGESSDGLNGLITTRDDGLVGCGWSQSVTSGHLTQALVVRLDQSGNIEWQRFYDCVDYEFIEGCSIAQTADDGYVLIAHSPSAYSPSVTLLRLDATGSIIWQKRLQSSETIIPSELICTADYGFCLIGSTTSTSANSEVLIIKFDQTGTIVWQNTYGNAYNDYGVSIIQANDGGYLAVGSKELPSTYHEDVLVLKLDSTGSIQWQYTYGDLNDDQGRDVIQSENGNYVIAAETRSYGSGLTDYWLFELDSTGSIVWQKTYGDSHQEYLRDIKPSHDHGYLLTGLSRSFGSGDEDAFVLKMDAQGGLSEYCYLIGLTGIVPATSSLVVSTGSNTVTDDTFTSSPALLVDDYMSFEVQTLCYGCTDDPYESDSLGDVSVAKAILGGQTQIHNFWDMTDDWLQFHACPGQSFTISTRNLGMDADTVLELYDDSCTTPLASDNDSGDEPRASKLEWMAPITGSYYLRVTANEGFVNNVGAVGNFSYYNLVFEGETSPCSTWARKYSPISKKQLSSNEQSEKSSTDGRYKVVPAQDGGYLAAATRTNDLWTMKMDPEHAHEWELLIGGAGIETMNDLVRVRTGGYLIVGTTTSTGQGAQDGWLVRVDEQGLVSWQKSIGTVDEDSLTAVQQTDDDGFIAAGSSNDDIWLVKLTADGSLSWQYLYGGTSTESVGYVRQTWDEGYIVAGTTSSYGAGAEDVFVLRLDSTGSVIWSKTYGGQYEDQANDIIETPDNGFLIAGLSFSYGPDSPTFSNCWIVKTDYRGQISWQNIIGGDDNDTATALALSEHGGFIMVGSTGQADNTLDFFVVKYSDLGEIEWQKTYGDGSADDGATSVLALIDSGYFLGGYSDSGTADQAFFIKIPAAGFLNTSCSLINDSFYTHIRTEANNSFPTITNVTATASLINSFLESNTTVSDMTEECNLSLPLEVSGPGAIQALSFSNKTTLVWEDASLSGSDYFNVYRVERTDLINGSYGECYVPDVTYSTVSVPETPSSGEYWYFLVSGENVLGEGPLGHNSDGEARQNLTRCP
ncbi:hypothetical protein JXQ70_02820 [bacterium]|nr:hypothetical protein [bacterium]